ncbi:MAG TPA: ABC transporter ATP-binding protein, partial [Gemmataceae bacterium]
MTTPEPATPAAPDPGRFRRLLSRFVKPYRVPIALALVAMIANSALTLPLPLLQGWVLDRLVPLAGPAPGGAPDRGAAAAVIWTGLGLTLFCLAGRMALAWLAGCTMTRVSYEVIRELTDELHRKLQRLPMGYFDARQTGRIMARLTGDVGSLHVFVSGGTLQLVSDLVLAAGIAAVLLALRWELALVSFAVLPLYVL